MQNAKRDNIVHTILILLCWVLSLQIVAAAKSPSLDELKQLYQQHRQDIHGGTLSIRYSRIKHWETIHIEEQKRFFEDRFESEISKIMESNMSQEEKEKHIQRSERNYENGLYQVQKNFSERIESERIYKIDLINHLFLEKEIPVEADMNKDIINGAWDRYILTDGEGHWLSYTPEQQSVSLLPIAKNAFDTHYYGGLLYQGIITPDRFETFSQLSSIKEDQYKDQDVVVYELTNPEKAKSKLVIYTDPGIGYRYLKAETWFDGQLRYIRIAEAYQTIDGIPFPTYFENISYDLNREFREREAFQVKEARLNQPFDPNAFTVELTPATMINIIIPEDPNESKVFQPDPDKSLRLGISDILEQASSDPDYFKNREKRQ